MSKTDYIPIRYSVLELIEDLKQVLNGNLDVDFSKVGVWMNDEYTCVNVELQSWQTSDVTRVVSVNLF